MEFKKTSPIKQKGKQWKDLSRKEKIAATITLVLIALVILGFIGNATSNHNNQEAKPASDVKVDTKGSNFSASSDQSTSAPAPTPPPPATRQTKGKAATIGAGTFIGGKDVEAGLYDVTTTSGQSGNFYVKGSDSYNEILGVSDGQGVPKIRVQISDGDEIQVSSLSKVIFTPVSTPYSTAYATTTLYAGTFTVGQDIGAGRYIAKSASGQSGNFYVSGSDSYNEILGANDGMGVPSLTVNLTDSDTIAISSLSQVTLTPTN